MNSLLIAVVPLSLGAMVSPTLLGAVVLVMSSKISPRARAWVFTAGSFVVLAAITAAAPFLGKWLAAVNPTAIARIDVVLGLILLALAVRKLLTRKSSEASAKDRAPKHPQAQTPHLLEYFGFGAVMLATDFSSTVLYMAILKEAALSHDPDWARLAAVAMGFVAVMLPALLPTVLGTLAPKASDKLLKSLSAWMSKHSTAITVAICLVFAAVLLVKGLQPLLK